MLGLKVNPISTMGPWRMCKRKISPCRIKSILLVTLNMSDCVFSAYPVVIVRIYELYYIIITKSETCILAIFYGWNIQRSEAFEDYTACRQPVDVTIFPWRALGFRNCKHKSNSVVKFYLYLGSNYVHPFIYINPNGNITLIITNESRVE